MAHTNTCPAYAEAVLALRTAGARLAMIGMDRNRITDDEWAALEQLFAGRALRPGVTEHPTHPRAPCANMQNELVTQALVKAQHTTATMVYARHSSRHKHLLLHRQQAEEERRRLYTNSA